MGTVASVVLIVLLLIVVAGVVFAVALARRSKAQLAEGMTPAPGMTRDAPAEWAGQHSPEAKMHRRLNGLARTLDALPLGDASAIERQVALSQRVQELDRLLVAVAGAPESARRDAVTALAPKVDAVETEIGALATEPPLG